MQLSMSLSPMNLFEIGGYIELLPFSGRKRSIRMNRTCIDFVSENLKEDVNFSQIPLQGTDQQFHFTLELKDKYFILKSISGHSFKHNGIHTLESIIEYGDKVIISGNRLNFLEQDLANDPPFTFQDSLLSNSRLIHSDFPILLQGETGTGKSYLAQKVHQMSKRPGKFVQINLSAFSENLIESELFGHKKGAFTGAVHNKIGAFLEADHGTLFLDEIDSLPLELQTKLLLFFDSSKIRPVGSNSETRINCRLVFAAGRSLSHLVEQGKMRKDFFYRINASHQHKLLALRDSPEHLIQFCQKFGLENDILITKNLIDFYTTLPWPGNLRQLKGHLTKKMKLTKSRKIDFDEIDEELITQSSELSQLLENELMSLDRMKNIYARTVYNRFDQNLNGAAKKLEVSPKTLKKILMLNT